MLGLTVACMLLSLGLHVGPLTDPCRAPDKKHALPNALPVGSPTAAVLLATDWGLLGACGVAQVCRSCRKDWAALCLFTPEGQHTAGDLPLLWGRERKETTTQVQGTAMEHVK